MTREAYGYTGGNPLNRTDPSGLFWGEGTLSNVGSAIATGAKAVGELAVDHRHFLIDVATTSGAAFVVGTLCVGTAGVGCVVAGLAGVAATGYAAHVGSDAAFDDDHQIGAGGALAHSLTSTAVGALCGWVAGRGCIPALMTGSFERGPLAVGYAYLELLKMAITHHYPEGYKC